MSKLEYTHSVGDVLTDAETIILKDATDKFGIKRLASGIYFCKKCNTKFTGKAYVP